MATRQQGETSERENGLVLAMGSRLLEKHLHNADGDEMDIVVIIFTFAFNTYIENAICNPCPYCLGISSLSYHLLVMLIEIAIFSFC